MIKEQMPKPKPWPSDHDTKNKRYLITLDLRLPHLEVSMTFGAKDAFRRWRRQFASKQVGKSGAQILICDLVLQRGEVQRR